MAVDDHSRSAYVEARADERGATAAGFLQRALAHFERILTDNGACSVSRTFASTAAARGVRLKRTRPFRPQTNGKAEAFIKILQAEWAYQRPYHSNRERLDALPVFLVYYNQYRPHGGIGGATPASRLSTMSLGTTPSGRWRDGLWGVAAHGRRADGRAAWSSLPLDVRLGEPGSYEWRRDSGPVCGSER